MTQKTEQIQAAYNADRKAFGDKLNEMERTLKNRADRIDELEHQISLSSHADSEQKNELNFWNGKVANMRRDLDY